MNYANCADGKTSKGNEKLKSEIRKKFENQKIWLNHCARENWKSRGWRWKWNERGRRKILDAFADGLSGILDCWWDVKWLRFEIEMSDLNFLKKAAGGQGR